MKLIQDSIQPGKLLCLCEAQECCRDFLYILPFQQSMNTF